MASGKNVPATIPALGGEASLNRYLSEIRKFPLLTPEEEYVYGLRTATAGDDYTANSGTVTFAAGQTTKTITVLVNGDRVGESDEYFFVNLSNPTSSQLGSSQALGAILNDEQTWGTTAVAAARAR